MKKNIFRVVVLCLVASYAWFLRNDGLVNPGPAFAQDIGIVTPGDVMGNGNSVPSAPTDTPITSIIDQGICAVNGDSLIRSGGIWGCSIPSLPTINAKSVLCNPTGSSAAAQACTPAQMATLLGTWLNVRVAKTSAYAAVTGDCFQTFGLGGSATYVFTLNAASGYDAKCIFVVVNEDAANGKGLNVNGLAGDMLWPGQQAIIFNDNNVWSISKPARWRLPIGQTIQHNAASGTDTLTCTGAVGGVAGNNKCPNDGLGTGAGAFATVQVAANTIVGQWDCQNFAPTIQLASESFTESVNLRGPACPGYLQIFITGVPGTPTNVNWTSVSGQAALSARDFAISTVNGVNFISGGANSVGMASSQFGDIDVLNVSFGVFTGATGIQVTENGNFNCNGGTYAVTGNFGTHWFMQGSGSFICASQTISVPNALTFSNWLVIQGPSFFQANGTTFTGTGSAGGSTGVKYNISGCGTALLSGAVLPGATPGTPVSGAALTTTNCAGLL